jgi:hypothetical protein
MQPLIAALLVLTGLGCAPPTTPKHGVWTVPDGDTWLLRWRGRPAVTVDGRAVDPAAGQVRLGSDAAHRVVVGAHTWTAAPRERDPCATIRFAALGDGRASVDGVGPSAYWQGMLGEVVARRPAFVINTGDLVKRGRDAVEWARYFASLPPWPPMVAVRGNHDRGGLFERFGAGVSGLVWTWPVGPVFLVGLDTEGSEAELAEMLVGLDAALAKAAGRWTLVFLHRPVWSRGNHGTDSLGINARLVPILDRHRVDLVLAGHDHDYERFCPSRGLGAARCVAEGTTYVVTGGAATFTVPVPGVSAKVAGAQKAADAQASRVFSGSKHFIELVVGPDRLVAVVRRTRTGNVRPAGVIDQFELRRARPARCR